MVLVDFKGGATFAGLVGDAARLGGDHQPGGRAHPRRPHAGRAVRRDGAPPGAAARGRQLRVGPRLREGARRRRAPRAAAQRCSSSSTSSPRCSRPSRSSSTCSSPSAASAARSACTCCSPRSAWRRAACAASRRHLSYRIGLRTFSSRGVAGGPRRARRLRAAAGPGPGLPQARPVDAAAVQGRLRVRSPAPPRRHRPRPAPAYARAASCRSPSATCSPRASPSPSSSRRRRPAVAPVDSRAVLDIAVDRMLGHGPEAHQVWLPPLDVPDTLDALMGDLVEDPDLGLVSPSWRARGGLDRPARHRRPAARAAPRHADASNLAGAGRPRRRGRRSAQRQEHAAPHDRDQPRADHDPERVAVLRPRLRRRDVRRR